MDVSLEEVGALLLRWRDSGKPVTVLFSSEADNWRRSGKVVHVGLTEFDVSFDDGTSRSIVYSPAILHISEDGGSLHITHALSALRVVVYENAP